MTNTATKALHLQLIAMARRHERVRCNGAGADIRWYDHDHSQR
jgi:hypothetical protein